MVGGLASETNNTMISNCYSTGTVVGNQFIGGLIGISNLGSVSSSYSSCNVTGYSAGGGFVGSSAGLIQNCYSTGSVTRKSGSTFTDLGGFAGWSSGSNTINKCYSTGRVIYTNTTDPTDKGFVGKNAGGTYLNNFWDTETSLQATTAGTATGKTTVEMKTNTTFLDAGWDYTIWNIGDGINDGYPYLDWQNPSGTPLPVELTSFSAATNGSTVNLSWNTATEINNYGFEIQKSGVGSQKTEWSAIGFVNGNGNSNSPKNYSFIDDNVTAGKYSYRLKQIDNDGQFEYSKTVEVNLGAPKKFELSQNYPNPFNPTTTISYNIPEATNVKLTIFNILGQEIRTLVNEFKEAGVHTVNFNASELNSGLYIYKLQAGTFTLTKKMTLIK